MFRAIDFVMTSRIALSYDESFPVGAKNGRCRGRWP